MRVHGLHISACLLKSRGVWLKTIEPEDGFLAETLTRFDYVIF